MQRLGLDRQSDQLKEKCKRFNLDSGYRMFAQKQISIIDLIVVWDELSALSWAVLFKGLLTLANFSCQK